ncbi:SERCA-type calcium-translocating P-type ATPase [Syncephalis plumigaleata]|nr:SERCA-type calcium-translocating P-type ATPase [Syncephalis plumigaleata]
MNDAFLKSPKEALDYFQVLPEVGLSEEQVRTNRQVYGKNELPPDEATPLWELILEQFKDQMVIILLFAAGISFVLAIFEEQDGDQITAFVEPIVILLILIANATNERGKAIEALKEYSPDEAKVLRDGHVHKINAVDLVPGDIIDLAVGDKIPADCRVISIVSTQLRVDQAILTGESVNESIHDSRAVSQDMLNIVFSGSRSVVQTGSRTAIGNIHKSITSQISEKTPLKRKLDDFGDSLAKVISVICILVWLIAVALAVAAIPEGLAVVITTCLALDGQENAIVRSLPSVETLGCTSTGTLTTNQMSVQRVLFVHNESSDGITELHVSGTSYAPKVKSSPSERISGRFLVRVCAICNDSQLFYDSEHQVYSKIGEPTRQRLSASRETRIGRHEHQCPSIQRFINTHIESLVQRVHTFEFSRDRKSMSVLARDHGKSNATLYVKGAPESVLERCTHVRLSANDQVVPLTNALRELITNKIQEYGVGMALRCIGLAVREELSANPADWDVSDPKRFVEFEQNLTFIGLVGMIDPPRPEVADAIRRCRTAGIRVIVITGDNKATAEAICRSIGVFGRDEKLDDKSYTGKRAAVQRASLFSRTEPTHKSQLVDLLQSQGAVVAMTGDGVNDAPALKKADIGVAMGTGTDVAKLAADMILADDNFATIEGAVEEGRSIYNNTKQFIRYLIMVSIFLTVLLGMPEALIPVQLLWVNLVTDGLPATALGFNPPDHDIMRQPPRNGREPIVGRWLFVRYMVIGVYVGCATVFGYAWWFMYYANGPQITWNQLTNFHACSTLFPEIGCEMFTNIMSQRATTMSLSILVTIEMLNAMNSLSENESLLTLPLWNNFYLVGAIIMSMLLHFMILYVPFFSTLFSITPLNWEEWQAVLWISAPVIVIDEVLKWISRTFVAPPTKIKGE